MWRIDIEELNQKLPDRYQKILKNENAHLLTVDMMDKLIPENTDVLQTYDGERKASALALLNHYQLIAIVSQYHIF